MPSRRQHALFIEGHFLATPEVLLQLLTFQDQRLLAIALGAYALSQLISQHIGATGCDPAPLSQEAFATRVQDDITRWKKLATERQIRAD